MFCLQAQCNIVTSSPLYSCFTYWVYPRKETAVGISDVSKIIDCVRTNKGTDVAPVQSRHFADKGEREFYFW